jgi:hypothetical protein
MMYTSAGAKLTGEDDKKGQIKVGHYGDLALLSADFFSVPESEISRIESLLTIVGGKVVYAVENYDGAAEPSDPIEPAWSPIARFGGFQQSTSGVRQAMDVVEAALDSALQRQWREDGGYLRPIRELGFGGDPLGGCSGL